MSRLNWDADARYRSATKQAGHAFGKLTRAIAPVDGDKTARLNELALKRSRDAAARAAS